jgi:hypothetical protein
MHSSSSDALLGVSELLIKSQALYSLVLSVVELFLADVEGTSSGRNSTQRAKKTLNGC